MLRIILADDHKLVRNGVRMLLETDSQIFIADEAENGYQVIELLNGGVPVDIVLADIDMPDMDGLTLITQLKQLSPNIKIVMLSMHEDQSYVSKAFSQGADGYLLKSVTAQELIFALKFVHAGEKYLCSQVAFQLFDSVKQLSGSETNKPIESVDLDLSSRELEVLALVADGFTNAEMSDKLFLSKRTIEGHRQSLIDKTGVRNSTALIKFAMKHGLIS